MTSVSSYTEYFLFYCTSILTSWIISASWGDVRGLTLMFLLKLLNDGNWSVICVVWGLPPPLSPSVCSNVFWGGIWSNLVYWSSDVNSDFIFYSILSSYYQISTSSNINYGYLPTFGIDSPSFLWGY